MFVRAIRGATTIDNNSVSEIIDGTKTLLSEIITGNRINSDDIISIIFSTTKDINATFPAVAAREMGFLDIALMCTHEMEVPGGLKKCIRVLIHLNTVKSNRDIKHIYLKGAKTLRPDLVEKPKLTIAIDGPAAAGKSTIAKLISKRLGIVYLDTGAMYRTAALKILKEGIGIENKDKIATVVDNIDMDILFNNEEQHMFLDKKDVTHLIREPKISMAASDVSAIPRVRMKMVRLQREFAKENSVVMEGRDIGSFVLPKARIKIFLTATLEERARRRYLQLEDKAQEKVSVDTIAKEIASRDKNDARRSLAPLVKAEDAIEIDTTNLTIEQVTDKIVQYVNQMGD